MLRLGPLTALILVLVAAGCGGSLPELDTLPSQEGDWLSAKHHYDRGNYMRAVESLGGFVERHPGSKRLDEALLLLGLSRQEIGENLLAVEDFNRLIRDFPQSLHRERAEYERAQSFFNEILSPAKDPEPTETARDYFRSYLLRYPAGEHVEEAQQGLDRCLELLATKAYFNAQTYLRMKRYRAAVIYFEKALQIKPEFSRAGRTMGALARAQENLGQQNSARATWQRLLDYITPERIERERDLEELRIEAERALRRLPEVAEGAESR
jgi:outer membrane protein assembly factor BamD